MHNAVCCVRSTLVEGASLQKTEKLYSSSAYVFQESRRRVYDVLLSYAANIFTFATLRCF